MKFEMKDNHWGGYQLEKDESDKLFVLGDIWLMKENNKNECS